MKGKIKFYKEDKGWGFITGDDGKDIFFHKSNVENPRNGMREGWEVEYETEEGDKGLKAVSIVLQ